MTEEAVEDPCDRQQGQRMQGRPARMSGTYDRKTSRTTWTKDKKKTFFFIIFVCVA